MDPPGFPASERDLEDLPEHVSGQIIDGELVVLPRPDHLHVGVASGLGMLLGAPLHFGFGGGPGGWVILDEPKIRFPPDLLVPDLAGWRRERFVAPRKGPYLIASDWVCEILSPSTARIDRIRKLPIYARDGVRFAWYIDPKLRILEVFQLHEGRWLLIGSHQNKDKVRAEPFEAVEVDLSLIWSDLPDEAEEEEDTEPAGL
jgi:Uma2 family endonuclease